MMSNTKDVLKQAAIAVACAPLLVGCVEGPEAEPELGDVEQHTICGFTDDTQPVNFYDGSFPGFSQSFVAARKRAVGAMESSASASMDVKYCSGTLISTNLYLTAGHCVGPGTVGDFVAFNYEMGFNPFPIIGVLPQTHHQIIEVVEDSLGGLDYAILRLAGTPGSTFGVTPVALADAADGALISMIGHPDGAPKLVEAGTIDHFSGSYMHYGNLDTLGGSSGSGILDTAGRIVGVHTNGGCMLVGGTNSGVRISRIRAVSNVL